MKNTKLKITEVIAIRNHIYRYGIGDYVSLEDTVKKVLEVLEVATKTKILYDKVEDTA